jgi:N6-adenosine-specific RNA methylase IME4
MSNNRQEAWRLCERLRKLIEDWHPHESADDHDAPGALCRSIGKKLNELDTLIKLPEEARRNLAERAKAGERVSAKAELKRRQRERREKELAEKTKAAAERLGNKLYSAIYADPPWRFKPWSRQTGMGRAAENHYPTMSIEDICALKIPAADDCVLFMWATVPMLAQALAVMQAWGFTYKNAMVWVKDREGTGFWFRNRFEILLVGTKGHVPAPVQGEQPPQVIQAPVGRHSQKPLAFIEAIERLFPNVPKIELFARQRRPGWAVWGNEVTGEGEEEPD